MNYVFTLYILKSYIVGRFYFGYTNNLARGFSEHNFGQTKSTKSIVPWNIIFTKDFFLNMMLKKLSCL